MTTKSITGRVLLLALLVRILVFAAAGRGIFLVGEGRTQADLATNILRGRGFMLSEEMLHPPGEETAPPFFQRTFQFYRRVDGFYGAMRPGRPTVFLVPGYAIFMAGVFALFGIGNFLAVSGIQLALGLLTVLIGLKIAGRFLSGGYLLWAGIFFALDPFELYYEAVPATQGLFTIPFLLGILLVLKLIDSSSGWKDRVLLPLWAGAAWAAAFYVRPAALPIMVWAALLLPLAPFLTGLMERFRGGTAPDRGLISLKGAGQSLVMAGTFALLMVPWGLRNREVTGSFRIMPAQGGVNIWEYNGRIFTDHFMDEIQGATLLYGNLRNSYIGRLNSPELAEFPEFSDEPEWVRDSILVSRNLRFMMANPGLTARLISLRFVEMFKPFPLNSFSILYTLAGIVSMFWVLVFLWGGAIRSAFHHGAGGFYLATLVAGYSLMHLLTASGTPHRVAIDFPMAVLAMIGLKYSLLRHRAWRESRNA